MSWTTVFSLSQILSQGVYFCVYRVYTKFSLVSTFQSEKSEHLIRICVTWD